jgi:subtilisin family serine protease
VDRQDAPFQDDLNGFTRNSSKKWGMKNVLIILVGVIVLATASHTPGFAQEGKPPHVPPIPTPQGRGREVHPPRRGADLIAAAQTQGPMKVIVELNVPFIPEGRLINPGVETVATSGAVRAQRAAIADTKRALISQMVGHNVTVTATWEGLPGIAVTANAAALQALQNSPLVRSIYEDVPEPPVMGYNLPYLSVSSAGGAWDQGVDGSGQTVAVLDVGTFASHEFLSGKVVAEACFSTNSPSANPLYDAHSLCPGAATSYTGSGAADPYARCVGLAGSFNCGHGTHVAGIIAGNWGSYSASSLVQPINISAIVTARRAGISPVC